MAMLAEPKSKQKWSSDPRNTAWTNDTSRFGYQMLTKMGWENGKGLGAKEDGTKTHVKSVKRQNNLGLGAEKSHEDNWISHQVAFDDLLSQLNSHAENDNEEKSVKKEKSHEMEKKARQSRKRVFYNRFIQSKDLSSKSAEDMACILGQRSKSAPGTPQEQSEDEESDESTASCPPPSSHGVQTVNSGKSIQEYFEMKMKEMEAARERKQTVEASATREETVSGQDHGEEVGESEPKKKRKKESKRKRKQAIEDGELVNNVRVLHSINVQCPAGKRKKNGAVEKTKSGSESECKPSKDRTEEKGKKKKTKEIFGETLEVDNSSLGRLDTAEGVRDKKKKSTKRSEKGIVGSENEDLEKLYEGERRSDKKDGSFSEDKSFNETIPEVEETNDKGNKRKKKDKDIVNSLGTVERMEDGKKKRKKVKKEKSRKKERGDQKHR
ncbi:PIN2/TERF1-interacting telomerase inhibitor 1-like [Stylophora pistillata]|uniref:PIN2/TERF1-interacting telomerase inhibitor 1-like n=1 Tax=Stylophora pistillata TaxID=50429 RepID=UPI000C04C494|nr:PIN2/TERF1-interacting telomerase inhibitor 1-like [Stylophora pistillata]